MFCGEPQGEGGAPPHLAISEDAGLAPMFFEGEVRLIEAFVENFVYQPYGGSLDVKLWRVG